MSEKPVDVSLGNILVVDDTLANLNLLVGLVKSKGYRGCPVPSGQLALQAAVIEPHELIMLDGLVDPYVSNRKSN